MKGKQLLAARLAASLHHVSGPAGVCLFSDFVVMLVECRVTGGPRARARQTGSTSSAWPARRFHRGSPPRGRGYSLRTGRPDGLAGGSPVRFTVTRSSPATCNGACAPRAPGSGSLRFPPRRPGGPQHLVHHERGVPRTWANVRHRYSPITPSIIIWNPPSEEHDDHQRGPSLHGESPGQAHGQDEERVQEAQDGDDEAGERHEPDRQERVPQDAVEQVGELAGERPP